MDLSLKYYTFNIEIHGFHNIQSEICMNTNKSKDFLGFQDKILRQNIQSNRNCKWSKTIPIKQFSCK